MAKNDLPWQHHASRPTGYFLGSSSFEVLEHTDEVILPSTS
jgi:hypothetical protein